MFRSDYSKLKLEADQLIQAERKQFLDVFKITDLYVEENELLLGGQLGINLVYGDETYENYFYEIYAPNAFKHATAIANNITTKSPKRVVRLTTLSAHRVYQIYVDTRFLMVFYNINIRSGVNYLKLVEPVSKTLRKRKVMVIPPEIQLLDLYRKLYLPNYAGDWSKLLQNENKMFSIVLSRKYTIQKEGAREDNNRQKIEGALLNYVSKSNKILIGEHACQILLGIQFHGNIIETISFSPIEEDIAEITELVGRITHEPVNAITRNLEVIGDYRLSRTTIKLGEDRPRELMYIYNSAEYDLIPYNILDSGTRTLWIANPFVILRFLLVNLWIIRRVRELNLIDIKYANGRIESIISLIIELRKKLVPVGELLGSTAEISKELIATDHPLSVFQTKRYAGVFIAEDLAFKIERANSTERYSDYYPLDYQNKFGHFRVIE